MLIPPEETQIICCFSYLLSLKQIRSWGYSATRVQIGTLGMPGWPGRVRTQPHDPIGRVH